MVIGVVAQVVEVPPPAPATHLHLFFLNHFQCFPILPMGWDHLKVHTVDMSRFGQFSMRDFLISGELLMDASLVMKRKQCTGQTCGTKCSTCRDFGVAVVEPQFQVPVGRRGSVDISPKFL